MKKLLKQRWVVALLAIVATAGAIWYWNKMKKDADETAEQPLTGTPKTDTKAAPKTQVPMQDKTVNPNGRSAASLTAIRLR